MMNITKTHLCAFGIYPVVFNDNGDDSFESWRWTRCRVVEGIKHFGDLPLF